MSYTISWHTENYIMLVELSGVITEDELTAIADESFEMVQQSPNRIHAIVDQSAIESMPKSLKVLSNSMPRNRSSNQGITVLIVPDMNRFGKFISSMLMQLVGLEYRMVNSMDEAEELLMGLKQY